MDMLNAFFVSANFECWHMFNACMCILFNIYAEYQKILRK